MLVGLRLYAASAREYQVDHDGFAGLGCLDQRSAGFDR
jgi:hypothetical protein